MTQKAPYIEWNIQLDYKWSHGYTVYELAGDIQNALNKSLQY